MSDESKPFYKGHEGFDEIIADPKLSRPGRVIRVYNYGCTAGDEKLYVLGVNQKLFDTNNGREIQPEEVLNRDNAPDGWSVEGLELSLLPQSEIQKLI